MIRKHNPCFRLGLISAMLCAALPFTVQAQETTESAAAQPVWTHISSGGTHHLAAKSDGTVWAWGSNSNGQLGTGERGDAQYSPVQVKGLSNVVGLGTGNMNSYAVSKEGILWSWGDNTDGQVGDGKETVRAVPSGDIIEDHTRLTPVALKNIPPMTCVTGNYAASYSLDKEGNIWGWGFISVPYQTTPVKLKEWSKVKQFSVDSLGYILAIKQDGTVWTGNKKGPKQVAGLSHVSSVATNSGTNFALKEDGTVWSWGSNVWGQIGDGTTIDREYPVQNPYMRNVKQIQATFGGPVYLKSDGTVWTHGSNIGGQLGNGSYEASLTPIQVIGLRGIKEISSNNTGGRVLALREDGVLWAWGQGPTGDGTQWWRTTPVMVKSYEEQPLETADAIKVELEGKLVKFPVMPFLENNATLVPMRAIFKALGASVVWDEAALSVTAESQGISLRIDLGASQAYLNSQPVPLDTPAELRDGTVFVPLRFLAEALGKQVQWEEASHTAILK